MDTEQTVQLGVTVEVELADGRVQAFRIGRRSETNPTQGVISHECPLGAAIMGTKAGDERTYSVNGGPKRIVKVLKVTVPEA